MLRAVVPSVLLVKDLLYHLLLVLLILHRESTLLANLQLIQSSCSVRLHEIVCQGVLALMDVLQMLRLLFKCTGLGCSLS